MANSWEENDSQNPEYPSWNWKESDWSRYLLITESQIRQFSSLYHLLIDAPDRLDRVAERMGWTAENWEAPDLEDAAEATSVAPDPEELPYTMHLHPVYTVTRGVFRSLYELSMAFAKLNGNNSLLQMSILATMHEAETQAILGIESQDMGDMALTVCHFKRSLAHLNHTLSLLGRMEDEKVSGAELYNREAKKRIFDLREIWLRVNSEVRENIRRGGPSGNSGDINGNGDARG